MGLLARLVLESARYWFSSKNLFLSLSSILFFCFLFPSFNQTTFNQWTLWPNQLSTLSNNASPQNHWIESIITPPTVSYYSSSIVTSSSRCHGKLLPRPLRRRQSHGQHNTRLFKSSNKRSTDDLPAPKRNRRVYLLPLDVPRQRIFLANGLVGILGWVEFIPPILVPTYF